MPVGIGRRRIAQQRIAGKSIGAQYAVENEQAPASFPPGVAHTWTVPKSGYWLFVAWSAGSKPAGTYAGCSGAYGEITKPLLAGQTVSITVGPETAAAAVNTVLTFPDGTVATAVNAAADTAGTATGFDYSLAGSLGGAAGAGATGAAGLGTGGGAGGVGSGATSGGAGAPARLPFRGGAGGGFRYGNFRRSGSPGAGGSESTTLDSDVQGDGLVLAYLVRE